MDIQLPEDLISLHEKLSEFAKHHQNKGGQMAHQLIKKRFIGDEKSIAKDGSKEGLLFEEGRQAVIKAILSMLHTTFAP
jgi:hypothetical protein